MKQKMASLVSPDRVSPDERAKLPDRAVLLAAAKWFLEEARKVEEVSQIALIGSLTTRKTTPKDVDLLVTLKSSAGFKQIATLARKLQGRIQKGSLGADVFIVHDNIYIGRACHYRESSSRVECRTRHLKCSRDVKFLCNTVSSFRLREEIMLRPPLILWPDVVINVALPDDVIECFALPRHNRNWCIALRNAHLINQPSGNAREMEGTPKVRGAAARREGLAMNGSPWTAEQKLCPPLSFNKLR
jgi:predicted nucleotidyltransferase